jgi:predicted ATPase
MGVTASPGAINCKSEWAFKRLKVAIRSFVQAICECNIPVIMFVDDLQYADVGSVELLRYLAV